LGFKVIAESLETVEQLNILKEADWIQMYYFSKPLIPKAMIEKVSDIFWEEDTGHQAFPRAMNNSWQ